MAAADDGKFESAAIDIGTRADDTELAHREVYVVLLYRIHCLYRGLGVSDGITICDCVIVVGAIVLLW